VGRTRLPGRGTSAGRPSLWPGERTCWPSRRIGCGTHWPGLLPRPPCEQRPRRTPIRSKPYWTNCSRSWPRSSPGSETASPRTPSVDGVTRAGCLQLETPRRPSFDPKTSVAGLLVLPYAPRARGHQPPHRRPGPRRSRLCVEAAPGRGAHRPAAEV